MKPKTFVQYFHTDNSGALAEGCGSNAVFILDGRNCLAAQHQHAIERAYRLRHIASWKAYQLRYGTFTHSCCSGPLHPLTPKDYQHYPQCYTV